MWCILAVSLAMREPSFDESSSSTDPHAQRHFDSLNDMQADLTQQHVEWSVDNLDKMLSIVCVCSPKNTFTQQHVNSTVDNTFVEHAKLWDATAFGANQRSALTYSE